MTASAQALSYAWDTTGTSEEAQYIANESFLICRRLQDSIALGLEGKGVFSELTSVYAECSQPNWDGYGALRVLPETYSNANSFLQMLPQLDFPRPSVSAEPDGHITFEWHSARRKTLSVSIAPDGNLHYAAILGPITRYGTEPIGAHGSVIEDLVHKVRQTNAIPIFEA